MSDIVHLWRAPLLGVWCPDPRLVMGSLNATSRLSEVTCHACLEAVIRFGEGCARRIVQLDVAAGEQGGPLFVDCDCGATWHHKNNYPCARQRAKLGIP